MRYLEVEQIIRINDKIFQRSLSDPRVEYSGRNDYTTSTPKIERLVELAPKGTILEVATYFLKNIILLQAFPNANHRTAMLVVEQFLKNNRKRLRYSKEEVVEFHRSFFNIQSRVYGTLEARGVGVLTEKRNEFYEHCRKFLEDHLAEGD